MSRTRTSITATLSPRTTRAVVNLTGFEVTILGGINGVVLTINGLIGGTITYYIPVATIGSGARFGEAALAIHGFSSGIRPD